MDISGLHREHREAVANALLSLQFVEEGMRMYLGHSFEIIAAHVRDVFPYKRTRGDVHKKAWGQLLHELKQMCANEPLLAQLTSLHADRNFCAHEAFLLTTAESSDRAYLTGAVAKLTGIGARADRCARSLFTDMHALTERATASMAKRGPGGAA